MRPGGVRNTRPPAVPALRRLLAAVLGLVALAASGCGIEPVQSDPTGVDQLVVPSPSPDPADFVAGVDNPWFPLPVAATWVYASTADGHTVTVTVPGETRPVAGVETTVVRSVTTDATGETVAGTDRWYAQDRSGNVWSFGEQSTVVPPGGRDGSWAAGVDGAGAGLAMAAEPRFGDGYFRGGRVGVAEEHATVLSLDASADVPAGAFTGLVETEDASALDPGLVRHRFFARDVGLILQQDVAGGQDQLELVSYDDGRG